MEFNSYNTLNSIKNEKERHIVLRGEKSISREEVLVTIEEVQSPIKIKYPLTISQKSIKSNLEINRI